MSVIETTGKTEVELRDELTSYEVTIGEGIASFVATGNAFLAIKTNKHYKLAGYSTFEDYCERRWNIGRAHGHRLVLAASTVESMAKELGGMSPEWGHQDRFRQNGSGPAIGAKPPEPGVAPITVLLPQSEAQARPLTKLRSEPKVAADAWTEAVMAAAGEQPTAALVEQAVAKRLPPVVRPEPSPEQIAAEDHAGQIRRAVKRLEMFCSSLHQFRDLRTSPNRAEILRSLGESDRQIILRAEREITWTRN